MMNGLPSWSGFLDRDKCIVSTTKTLPITDFGDFKYVVIPFDGAIFGVCPDDDIWNARINDEYSFNAQLLNTLKDNNISDSSLNEMVNDLEKLYIKWNKGINIEKYFFNDFFNFIKENNYSIYDGLDIFFNPNNFIVKVVTQKVIK